MFANALKILSLRMVVQMPVPYIDNSINIFHVLTHHTHTHTYTSNIN